MRTRSEPRSRILRLLFAVVLTSCGAGEAAEEPGRVHCSTHDTDGRACVSTGQCIHVWSREMRPMDEGCEIGDWRMTCLEAPSGVDSRKVVLFEQTTPYRSSDGRLAEMSEMTGFRDWHVCEQDDEECYRCRDIANQSATRDAGVEPPQ